MNEVSDCLLVERRGSTQLLRLNRPERHHAINYELGVAIRDAIERTEDDDTVRAIIITGSGEKAFCAGQDMLEMSGVESSEEVQQNVKSSSAAIAVERVASASKPVIAAINGYCYGGGALLALACDIRIAGDAATFRLPGAEYGLVVGAAWAPRLVGSSKAKELIFTARKFDAAEAYECGFISQLCAPNDVMVRAQDLADAISVNSPRAVRESKRVIDAASLNQDAVDLENEINKELRGSAEQTARFNAATTSVTGKVVK